MLSYAIMGASRGIGLEYVRQLASRPDTVVFAIVRNPTGSTHLQDAVAGLKNVHIVAGDVSNYSTLERAAKQAAEVTGGTLDYLIHSAANMDINVVHKAFDDYTNMEELDGEFISAFKVNSLGPVHSIMAFLPLLRASSTKKIVIISSGAGDIKAVQTLGMANMAAYGMTKAAAVNATTKFAVKLKDEGFVVITLAPGMVDTSARAGADSTLTVISLACRCVNPSLSGDVVAEGYAAFRLSVKDYTGIQVPTQTPAASVGTQLVVIDGLAPSHNGLFLSYMSGEYHPPN